MQDFVHQPYVMPGKPRDCVLLAMLNSNSEGCTQTLKLTVIASDLRPSSETSEPLNTKDSKSPTASQTLNPKHEKLESPTKPQNPCRLTGFRGTLAD